MKRLTPLFALVILFSACGQADPNTRHVTSPGAYENPDAKISLHYPIHWTVKIIDEVPNQYRVERLSGDEGGIQVTWGQAPGGACTENGQTKALEQLKLNGRTFNICHVIQNNVEEWRLLSWGSGNNKGSIDAYAKGASMQNRQVVLDTLRTLTIAQ